MAEKNKSDLRRRAENIFAKKDKKKPKPQNEAEWQRNIQELQIHQIEMEMQQEEIEREKEEIKQSLNYWQTTFDATADSFMLLDKDFRIIRANAPTARFLNLPIDQIIGQHCFKLFHGTNEPLVNCPYACLKTSLIHETTELYIKEKDIWVNISVNPILDESGKLEQVVHVIGDITEHKKILEELKEAQNKFIQSNKMAALGELAGGVAHEFNNPLTGVLNNVQLIKLLAEQKKDFSLCDFKELLDVIEVSALRCQKIARSMLNFAHNSKGVISSLSLNEIAEKTINLVLQELKLNNISINKEFQPDLPMIQGDSQLLQQVVLVLVNNSSWAIHKKSNEGGVITMKTGFDLKKKVVTMSISDTGIGIPQENMTRLFTPFFTTKDVGEGTGLGLALTYNIIKSHQGSINVESEVGVGTTFNISLPTIPEV